MTRTAYNPRIMNTPTRLNNSSLMLLTHRFSRVSKGRSQFQHLVGFIFLCQHTQEPGSMPLWDVTFYMHSKYSAQSALYISTLAMKRPSRVRTMLTWRTKHFLSFFYLRLDKQIKGFTSNAVQGLFRIFQNIFDIVTTVYCRTHVKGFNSSTYKTFWSYLLTL